MELPRGKDTFKEEITLLVSDALLVVGQAESQRKQQKAKLLTCLSHNISNFIRKRSALSE